MRCRINTELGPSWATVRQQAGLTMSAARLPNIRCAAAALASLVLTTVGATAQATDAKRLRLGEHLAQECTSCHRRDGTDNGIPSILGMKVEAFVETMTYYQSGARENPAMVSVAKSLDEDQIQALAAYFATLPPPPKAAGKR